MGNTSTTPEGPTAQGDPDQSKSSPDAKSCESSFNLSAEEKSRKLAQKGIAKEERNKIKDDKICGSSSNLSKDLQAMSSRYSPRLNCAVCSNLHTLHSHCKICGNICENCSKFHNKGNAFKNHIVVNIALPMGTKANPIEIEPSVEQDILKSNCTKTSSNEFPSGSKSAKLTEIRGVKREPDCNTMQKMKVVLPMVNEKQQIKKEQSTQQEFLKSNCTKTSLDDSPSTLTPFKLPDKKGMKRKSDSFTIKNMENAVCRKHKSNLVDLCCQDCNKAICSQCLAIGHSGHKIGSITTFFESKRARIKIDLGLIQSHIKQREEEKEKLTKEQEKMDQATDNVVKEIKDITEKMQTVIQQKIDDLKTQARDVKKMMTSKRGDFNKEINRLETLRKKCQDELSTKDLGVVLFTKDKTPLLEDYQILPNSYKITPPQFIHGALDPEIINSFGTIVPATIQEEAIAFNPLPDFSSNSQMTDTGKKKQRVDVGSLLPISTARVPSSQEEEILKDAVIPIYLELGKNIV